MTVKLKFIMKKYYKKNIKWIKYNLNYAINEEVYSILSLNSIEFIKMDNIFLPSYSKFTKALTSLQNLKNLDLKFLTYESISRILPKNMISLKNLTLSHVKIDDKFNEKCST